MNEEETTLTNLYDGWAIYQQYIVSSIASLTEAQLNLRVAAHMRTVGEIVRHIIGGRVHWFAGVMGIGSEEVAALPLFNRSDSRYQANELVGALETTWKVIYDTLMGWTPADMAGIFEGIHDNEKHKFSRQWVVWHVLEHDMNHGGELFLTLGIHGLPTPDL